MLKIGTRGSPLALAQTHEARRRLAVANECDESCYKVVVIRTTGDIIQDRTLVDAGGKGLFTKEIDAALLNGEIDVAAHSAKDLPSRLPDGVAIVGYLPREDVRDAFVSPKPRGLAALPQIEATMRALRGLDCRIGRRPCWISTHSSRPSVKARSG